MEPMVSYKNVKKKSTRMECIFIVDDDISYLYPLVFHLQKRTQYRIYCFTNGEECMENIHLKPSVIILDFNLNPQPPAKMNGLDVLRRIKNANPKIKVVILSGRDEYQGVLDSLKQGAYTYVLKDTEALVSIKKILDVLSNNTFDSQDRGIDTP